MLDQFGLRGTMFEDVLLCVAPPEGGFSMQTTDSGAWRIDNDKINRFGWMQLNQYTGSFCSLFQLF